MKKKLILFTLLIFALNSYAQESELNWLTDFELAKQEAKAQDKPILMYFTGSDWCAPCKKLKADFFNSEKFAKASSNVVLLMIDLPRRSGIITPAQKRKNMLLMQRYNRRGSFPALVGLNFEGKILKELNGYNAQRDTSKHFEFIVDIVKQN